MTKLQEFQGIVRELKRILAEQQKIREATGKQAQLTTGKTREQLDPNMVKALDDMSESQAGLSAATDKVVRKMANKTLGQDVGPWQHADA